MRKWLVLLVVLLLVACGYSVTNKGSKGLVKGVSYEDSLRYLYSLPTHQWPKPLVDSLVSWKELGVIPASPLQPFMDSLQYKIQLGKILFFDTRLSTDNTISCSSCHLPEKSWTDALPRSLGHAQRVNRRNSPTLLNVWHYHRLFWDGRSNSLEDQAFAPINNETEMNSDMAEVMMKLRRVEGYKSLFEKAFGTTSITPDNMTEALAVFQRTLVSDKAALDHFLEGDKTAMSDAALRGLHLFRTEAGCMNCHYGPLLTDNSFHTTGLINNPAMEEDLGRYYNTRKPADKGSFKTPSLRDVFFTGPWMHNGSFTQLEEAIDAHLSVSQDITAAYTTDRLIKPVQLNRKEKEDLLAFLQAVSSPAPEIKLPVIPQ